ncbi:hypothetical protein KZ829_18725 [Actinoplanes hulinensis]|uniref:Uncharacterized protein n=1 Tax=Actinoplanes hulinensis TaxID=1144547 RepID=A0ABS7B445_9ACTN|nr:hypothetical protein [Actinoplanes hulinensis]MBW6435780.1 hypothetical protein [Actinoplanes hulinensis]
MLIERDEIRRVFRETVDAGGDVVDVALAAQAHGWGRHCVYTAIAFRAEFGVSIKEALNFAGWIEGSVATEESCRMLREGVPTPLR